jgi:hypothetical protein
MDADLVDLRSEKKNKKISSLGTAPDAGSCKKIPELASMI